MKANVALLSSIILAACGGAKVDAPPPEAPVQAPQPAPVKSSNAPSVSQELGSIDPKMVAQTVSEITPKLKACRDRGASRIEYLAGDIKFFVRIRASGEVKYAYPEESTLGDRETEMCMLHAIEKAKWPAPIGGEAEVQFPLSFDIGDARPPFDWSGDKVVNVIGKHEADLARCKNGRNTDFHATAYVVPNGSGVGKVSAVGVAVSKREDADSIECVVSAIRGWKMPSPGSYAAKVSFVF